MIHAAIHHGHFGASYQNLTKILRLLSWGPYTSLTAISPVISHGSVHLVGLLSKRCCLSATLWRNSRATVLWLRAASGMSIESSNVLPICGRDSQGTSRTREGQTCCRSCRPALRIRDERHAGSQEVTAGEEKHISVWIEVSDRYLFLTYREKGKRYVASGSPQTRSRTPSSWYGIRTRT